MREGVGSLFRPTSDDRLTPMAEKDSRPPHDDPFAMSQPLHRQLFLAVRTAGTGDTTRKPTLYTRW